MQNGRIFALDPDLFSSGVRLIGAVEQVAAALDAPRPSEISAGTRRSGVERRRP